MDSMHMGYDEVMHSPYSLLLAMQADKLRADTKSDDVKTISGRDMLAKKRKQTT